jgi:hypothetical protein
MVIVIGSLLGQGETMGRVASDCGARGWEGRF